MSSIAVDIDSTLYDFESPAREGFLRLAEKYDNKDLFMGAYDPWTEWRSPADSCGLDIWLEVIALCHDPDVILSRTPFDGALETCLALEGAGHELLFISARDGVAEEATKAWLHQWGFLGKHGHLVCAHDKTEHMRECQYLIDDRPKTVIDFVYDRDWTNRISAELPASTYGEATRKAFVKEYPYNQNLTDIPNLYLAPTWAGINYYLVEQGLLERPAYKPLGLLD